MSADPQNTPQAQQGQPVPTQPHTGIIGRAWSGLMEARARRATRQAATRAARVQTQAQAAQPGQPAAVPSTSLEGESMDRIERAKLSFARAFFFLGAFILMGIAAWSVGFFFSGLHDFTLNDQETAAAYVGSFALEGIFTGLLFTVAFNKHRHRPWLLIFLAAISLALVSMLAQFSAYEALLAQGKLSVSDSQIEAIPLLSWLIGSMHGHSFLFLLRGASFHMAEIYACLAMPSKLPTIQERQQALVTRLMESVALETEARIIAGIKVYQAPAQQPLALPAPTQAQGAPAGYVDLAQLAPLFQALGAANGASHNGNGATPKSSTT